MEFYKVLLSIAMLSATLIFSSCSLVKLNREQPKMVNTSIVEEIFAQESGMTESEDSVKPQVYIENDSSTNYSFLPGAVYENNSAFVVEPNSGNCWIYVKITTNKVADEILEYELDRKWTHLVDGLYYSEAWQSGIQQKIPIFNDNSIAIRADVDSSYADETIVFSYTGYAITKEASSNPYFAWQSIYG